MPSFRSPRLRAGAIGSGAVIAAVIGTWLPSWNVMATRQLSAGAFQAPQTDTTSSNEAKFTIFLRSTPIGNETVSLDRTADGWTITSSGRAGVPVDFVSRQVQVRYSPDWKPIGLTIDATLRGQAVTGRTTISGSTAQNSFTQAGKLTERTDPITPDAVLLSNPSWGPFEAVSQRLRTATAGSTIPAYALGGSFQIQVGASSNETLQMGTRSISAKRTALTLMSAGAPLGMEVWGDERGRLMRVSIPAQNLEVVRDDIGSVAVRYVVVSRPGDQEIRFPANGFRLAGTVSTPADAATSKIKLPVVILVGGSGPTDRDETIYGIPIFGQLAGALADAGFAVVRYDKRGIGQSGGRVESATLQDFADDLLAVVNTVRRMPTVDRDRLAVIGHSEGGAVAMLAAARQKDIKALALISTTGATGAELNLAQVAHALDRSTRTPAEKAETLALQKKIQTAVVSGSGWDAIAPQYRQQADIPWFKSFLTYDPAKVMPRVSQPILVVQGLLDTQVAPTNADRLAELARQRKKSAVDVIKVPGVNHLLVAATTGELDEYASLKDKQVSPAVSGAVVSWLQKTFAAVR
jgi:pimeloyl-ACP methyl ester carboxylesterase